MAIASDSRGVLSRARSASDFSNSANGLVIGFYLLPVLLFVTYASWVALPEVSWGILILGALLTCFGSVVLLLSLRSWEHALRQEYTKNPPEAPASVVVQEAPPPIAAAQPVELDTAADNRLQEQQALYDAKCAELTDAVEEIRLQQVELEHLAGQNQQLQQRLKGIEDGSSGVKEEISRKDALMKEYQQTITEQRAIIEKKQHYISKLELTVQDLKYEVKTLLQLGDINQGGDGSRVHHPALDVFDGSEPAENEMEALYQGLPGSSDQVVRSQYDANLHLNRYIEMAKTITGARHLAGGESRFSDLSVDSYAIDLRRLYESFRSETGCAILLYSFTDRRMLFANEQVRGLVGWGPDKFVKEFESLVQQGLSEWNHALSLVKGQPQAQVRLILKSKAGSDTFVNCTLGRVPSGVFKDHVIGVLYRA